MVERSPSLAQRLSRVIHTVHRIIGAPDYHGYLTHMREMQPGCRVMSYEEFARDVQERKYTQPGSRCC